MHAADRAKRLETGARINEKCSIPVSSVSE
jgi:hypothetical protein